ncbi:MAG: hypothetical protein JXJ22_02020 [Bacteroidales bacterium]|nr:hypothetical protein [Bacteroidales bacterium]
MNYPIWELHSITGGTLIAIIAILHAFVAHFAVGGGLFLVLTERKALRTNNPALLAYVQSHTKFFLLLTLVFGGVSGVGIWFIISLVNPAGTSSLIHNFVFGWATEWVFFTGEIIALLIYHNRFGKMDSKSHLAIGWFYFIFAWLSLFVINGILSFMLTPGKWLETQNFWHGFFNPGFFPSLFFRTGIALFIAGIFGMLTSLSNKNTPIWDTLVNYCLKWIYLPFILILLSGFWYFKIVPETSLDNLLVSNAEAIKAINIFVYASILIFILAVFFVIRFPNTVRKMATVLFILVGLIWFGGFEYIREFARRPYLINQYLYSNSIYKSNTDAINKEGILNTAKWISNENINPGEKLLNDGKEIFSLECSSCHTLTGRNQIFNKTLYFTERGLIAKLSGLNKINNYMPGFFGTEDEKAALSAYILRSVHGKPAPKEEIVNVQSLESKPSEFNSRKDKYVLLVWNDLGMHCVSDNDKYFSFLPPANTLYAQLIKRGERPEIINTNVTLEYEVEEGFRNPQNHVDFWQYSEIVYGAKFQEGYGLAGNGISGSLKFNENKGAFMAEYIPVTAYNDNNTYNPYPSFTIRAIDNNRNKLAETRAITPTSTEMGCRNCHGGAWRVNNISGFSEETAINILRVHDRMNKTSLLNNALNGKPALCQSCHEDPALGAPGNPTILNFSSAVHGFHAQVLPDMDADACALCHPARVLGNTSCSRGRHNTRGLNCVHCHGTIEDHAVALVKNEKIKKKPAADKLLANLSPRKVATQAEVNPRMPWLMEPDCKACHGNFNIREEGKGVNGFNNWVPGGAALYRNTVDNNGVYCAACHGSPHAIYPAINKYGRDRDNMQPLQYQGIAGSIATQNNCKVCHTVDMKYNGHHRNMLKFDKLNLKNKDVALK